ncbi:MAG TPA: DinB family protein [Pseudonocardiaceae bacterium]|nr:DinB family protein [Pseudonocardiaceae bacterium]
MTDPFPDPSTGGGSTRADVFLTYLDFFRGGLVQKVESLSETERRTSRLPSGWTPLELLKHLTYVELRWFEWGFAGQECADPWGDDKDGRWYVAPDETLADLVGALEKQADYTRFLVSSTDLERRGTPGPRWDGQRPATLERVLFHVMQEYARHLGHLDIVVELAGGPLGESI